MSKYSITGSAEEMGLHVRGYAKPRDRARRIDTIGWCVTIIIGQCHQVAQRTLCETSLVHLDASHLVEVRTPKLAVYTKTAARCYTLSARIHRPVKGIRIGLKETDGRTVLKAGTAIDQRSLDDGREVLPQPWAIGGVSW
jgi:hypothetical protein